MDGQSNDTLTYYDNGNLKTYKQITRDSIFDINFYSRSHNEVVDSMYRYRPFQDTLHAYDRYISNDHVAGQELDISRIKNDLGSNFSINLVKPKGERVFSYLKKITDLGKGALKYRGDNHELCNETYISAGHGGLKNKGIRN